MQSHAQEVEVTGPIPLTPEESERFAALLDSPPPPNEALRDAMERFRARAAGNTTGR